MAVRNKWFIVGVSAVLVVLAVVLSSQLYTVYNPIKFQEARFDGLARWVKEHRLQSESSALLPEQYRQLSATGRVYVTGAYIFVPSWLGRRSVLPNWLSHNRECDGYVFAEKNDLTNDGHFGKVDHLTIYAPNFKGLYGFDPVNGAVKSTLFVTDDEDDNWYILESQPTSALD